MNSSIDHRQLLGISFNPFRDFLPRTEEIETSATRHNLPVCAGYGHFAVYFNGSHSDLLKLNLSDYLPGLGVDNLFILASENSERIALTYTVVEATVNN